ncbi:DUF4190 domain-containing protein [Bifidobacterium aquikefiricola]|uniref:DUF4190 domain-containing protein n=1 Tax=Bifidobacterium aquikefiricola TaxID=3059038 RepID=A0AB39U4U7_9BIFI
MSSSERNPDQMGPSRNAGPSEHYGIQASDSPTPQHGNVHHDQAQGSYPHRAVDQQSNGGSVQNRQPQYGAMASQYPGWNPYVYGGPEPSQQEKTGDDTSQGQQQHQGAWAGNPFAGSPQAVGGNDGLSGSNSPDARQQASPSSASSPYGNAGNVNRRHMYPTIDPNDPNQNPLYGRWDPYAVLSFVLALFFPFPFMPAIMGAISVYRTRFFHMKGKGLAIAAIVINLLYSALMVWMWFNHINANQLYQDIYDWIGSLAGTTGNSVSA